MVTMKPHARTAELCIQIATESIDRIHAFYTSPYAQRTDRYSSVVFLTSAIIPLVCAIIADNTTACTRSTATRAYQTAIQMIRDMEPGLAYARRILRRLGKIISATDFAIARCTMDMALQSPDQVWHRDAFDSVDMTWLHQSPGTGITDLNPRSDPFEVGDQAFGDFRNGLDLAGACFDDHDFPSSDATVPAHAWCWHEHKPNAPCICNMN